MLGGCFSSSHRYTLNKSQLEKDGELKQIQEEIQILDRLLSEHIEHVHANSHRVDALDGWISFYALEVEPYLSDEAWEVYTFWLEKWSRSLGLTRESGIVIEQEDPITFYYFIRMISLMKRQDQFIKDIFVPTWKNLEQDDVIILMDTTQAHVTEILNYVQSLDSMLEEPDVSIM